MTTKNGYVEVCVFTLRPHMTHTFMVPTVGPEVSIVEAYIYSVFIYLSIHYSEISRKSFLYLRKLSPYVARAFALCALAR